LPPPLCDCVPLAGKKFPAGSVVPMEITFMDTEDEYKKYGTLISLRYIYSNPFRFPISSLGLPKFLLGKADRVHWQNILPTLEH
jgi:hypothetical protein